MSKEPSMEEILSSIRRVMAREDAESHNGPRVRTPVLRLDSEEQPDRFSGENYGQAPVGQMPSEPMVTDPILAEAPEAVDDEVLELTDTTSEADIYEPQPYAGEQPMNADEPSHADAAHLDAIAAAEREAELLSNEHIAASRQTLTQFAEAVKPAPRPDLPVGTVSLDAMVREAITPMLKDWLDQNLPTIVEEMVARELQRISGRAY